MGVDEVPFTEARARLADLVGRVAYGGERVVLTRHGRPAAALVPVADLQRLEALDHVDGSDEVIPLVQGSFDRSRSIDPDPMRRMDVAARLGRDPGIQ